MSSYIDYWLLIAVCCSNAARTGWRSMRGRTLEATCTSWWMTATTSWIGTACPTACRVRQWTDTGWCTSSHTTEAGWCTWSLESTGASWAWAWATWSSWAWDASWTPTTERCQHLRSNKVVIKLNLVSASLTTTWSNYNHRYIFVDSFLSQHLTHHTAHVSSLCVNIRNHSIHGFYSVQLQVINRTGGSHDHTSYVINIKPQLPQQNKTHSKGAQ